MYYISEEDFSTPGLKRVTCLLISLMRNLLELKSV